MKKITPQSLLFTIAPDIPPETLLIQASETLSSLNALTTDLAFELEGANRYKLLASQQLIVFAELLVERVLTLTQTTANKKGRDAFQRLGLLLPCALEIPARGYITLRGSPSVRQPEVRYPCSSP